MGSRHYTSAVNVLLSHLAHGLHHDVQGAIAFLQPLCVYLQLGLPIVMCLLVVFLLPSHELESITLFFSRLKAMGRGSEWSDDKLKHPFRAWIFVMEDIVDGIDLTAVIFKSTMLEDFASFAPPEGSDKTF